MLIQHDLSVIRVNLILMRSFSIRLLLLAICLAVASDCSFKSLSRGGEVFGSQAAYVIPIEYKSNMVFIEVEVNGVKRRFLVDTGATTVIDKSIYDKSEFEWVMNEVVHDADSRLDTVAIVKIRSLKIGSVEIQNTIAAVSDLSHFKCLNVVGMLGANVLAHFDLEIDYDQQKLTLHQDPVEDSYLEAFERRIGFKENDQRIPLLTVSWKAKQVDKQTPDRWHVRNMTLDVGSGGGVSVQKFYGTNPDFYDDKTWFYGFRTISLFGVSPVDTSYYLRLNDFRIDEEVFDNTIVNSNSYVFNHVGNDFWEDYRVLISWHRKAVFLKRTTPESEAILPDHTISLYIVGDELIITGLYEHSRLHDEGLATGDRILSVNGVSMSDMTEEEFCIWTKGIEEDQLYDFKFEVKDGIKSITLSGEELKPK